MSVKGEEIVVKKSNKILRGINAGLRNTQRRNLSSIVINKVVLTRKVHPVLNLNYAPSSV